MGRQGDAVLDKLQQRAVGGSISHHDPTEETAAILIQHQFFVNTLN